MIWSQTNIILAIIGMLGLLSTATVVVLPASDVTKLDVIVISETVWTSHSHHAVLTVVCSYCTNFWLRYIGASYQRLSTLLLLILTLMIKRIALAAIAAAATIMPAAAEVQPGTGRLLETVDENGIPVTINHPSVLLAYYNGQYRWLGFQRELRLCPGDTVDARDHDCASRSYPRYSTLCQCCSWYIYWYSSHWWRWLLWWHGLESSVHAWNPVDPTTTRVSGSLRLKRLLVLEPILQVN